VGYFRVIASAVVLLLVLPSRSRIGLKGGREGGREEGTCDFRREGEGRREGGREGGREEGEDLPRPCPYIVWQMSEIT